MSEASQQQPNGGSLQDVQRQLQALQQRMEQMESRLGLRASSWTSPPVTDSSIEPFAPPPSVTVPTVPPPIQQPMPRAAPPVSPPIVTAMPSASASTPHLKTRFGAASTVSDAPAPTPANAVTTGYYTVAPNTPMSPPSTLAGDWETLIGGKWALWIGSLSLFLALASFLAYTWRSLPPAPPAVRIAMGLAAGAVCLGIGCFSRTRTQRWFSEGISGAGLGIVYLSLWASTAYFHLLPLSIAFIAMALTTVLGGYLALRYDALSLSILATLGGFLTPLLLRDTTSSTAAITLLTYVAILNAGLLALSLHKRWSSLTWLSLAATTLLLGAWYFDAYQNTQRWLVFTFITLYFLEFLGAACFYSLARQQETSHSDLLLLFATTMTYAAAGYPLINGDGNPWPATFPLGLVLFFLIVSHTTKALALRNLTLRHSATGLALIFLTIAVPAQLHQQRLAIGWSVEAGTLLMLGAHFRGSLLKRAGQLVWALSLLALLNTLPDATLTPHLLFLNAKALPLLVSALVMAIVTIKLHQETRQNQSATAQSVAASAVSSAFADELAVWHAVYAVFVGAWLIAQETCRSFTWHLALAPGSQPAVLFVIACLLSGYALELFVVGMKQRHIVVLSSALAVATLAAALPLWASLAIPATDWAPFWNLRWLAYLVVTGNLVTIGRLISANETLFEPASLEALGILPGAIAVFALAGLTTETYCSFEHWKIPDPTTWQTAVCFALAMLWSAFATALLTFSVSGQHQGLRTLAYVIGSCALGMLLWASVDSNALLWTPLLNLRGLAFVVIAILLALGGQQAEAARPADADSAALEPEILGTSRSTTYKVLGNVLLLWGATQETYEACRHFHAVLGAHWDLKAQFIITLLWCGFAAMLLTLGLVKSRSLQGQAAYLIGCLACCLLLIAAWQATHLDWWPLLNLRCLAFIVVTTILGFSARALRRISISDLAPGEVELIRPIACLAISLLLWGLTQETYETCFYLRPGLGLHWDRWAAMFISLVWLLYGTALLIGGIRCRYQPMRLASLGLLGATVLKVFLFDLSFLNSYLKMLSLAGLGIALIFISWLYSRYGGEQQGKHSTP